MSYDGEKKNARRKFVGRKCRFTAYDGKTTSPKRICRFYVKYLRDTTGYNEKLQERTSIFEVVMLLNKNDAIYTKYYSLKHRDDVC